MKKDTFKLIQFEETESLVNIEGFSENSFPTLNSKYGKDSYLVSNKWLKSIGNNKDNSHKEFKIGDIIRYHHKFGIFLALFDKYTDKTKNHLTVRVIIEPDIIGDYIRFVNSIWLSKLFQIATKEEHKLFFETLTKHNLEWEYDTQTICEIPDYKKYKKGDILVNIFNSITFTEILVFDHYIEGMNFDFEASPYTDEYGRTFSTPDSDIPYSAMDYDVIKKEEIPIYLKNLLK